MPDETEMTAATRAQQEQEVDALLAAFQRDCEAVIGCYPSEESTLAKQRAITRNALRARLLAAAEAPGGGETAETGDDEPDPASHLPACPHYGANDWRSEMEQAEATWLTQVAQPVTDDDVRRAWRAAGRRGGGGGGDAMRLTTTPIEGGEALRIDQPDGGCIVIVQRGEMTATVHLDQDSVRWFCGMRRCYRRRRPATPSAQEGGRV